MKQLPEPWSPLNLLSYLVMIGLTGVVFQLLLVNQELIDQVRKELDKAPVVQECPVQPACPVTNSYVTNICPEYDQGWEDAQASECPELTTDELRSMCQDLEELGYVPDC